MKTQERIYLDYFTGNSPLMFFAALTTDLLSSYTDQVTDWFVKAYGWSNNICNDTDFHSVFPLT